MYGLSDNTTICGRLTVLIAVVFMHWQNLALFHHGVYVDAEIQIITNSNKNDQYEINECRVRENTSGISVIVNESCQLEVETTSSSVLAVEITEEYVNGTDLFCVESTDTAGKCSRYVTVDGYLRQCRAAFLQSKLRLHLRGSMILQLQEATLENLDSDTIEACPQQNRLISEPETPSENEVVSVSPQCGNIRGYDRKIMCGGKMSSPGQNLSDSPSSAIHCDMECSDECRCALAYREVIYCPDSSNRDNLKSNGLLGFPEEFIDLSMSYSFLFEIKKGTFKGMKRLLSLNLSQNVLTSLGEGIFEGLRDLTQLNLSSNLIESINENAFTGLNKLKFIDFENNMLTIIRPNTFRGLTSLVGLLLSFNNLQRLQPELFRDLAMLEFLTVYNNSLTKIESNTFSSVRAMRAILLSGNDISTLEPRAFDGVNIDWLTLSTNLLERIDEDAFKGLRGLIKLDLQENGLRILPSPCINDLRTLMLFNLSNNHLHVVPDLGPLKRAHVIDLRNNELSYVHRGTFHGLPNSTQVLVNEPVSCCFVSMKHQCIPSKPPPLYITCERLLPNTLLEVFMWVLGWSAVVGNIFVLIWRRRGKFEENQVQVLLITNLAASDMLMGVYMLIISSADIHFGRYFPAQAEYWRTSKLCQFAGVLAVSSSEASVFFVTLISIDRYTRIAFPYAAHQIRYHSARAISIALWVTALIIGIVPTVMLRISSELYDVSEVCIGLPLVRKQILGAVEVPYTDIYNRSLTRQRQVEKGTRPNMYFSIAVFLGVNLLCFFIVLFCYIEIFWTVKRTGFTTNRRGRDKEIRMAMKMAVIVLTDFVCWMPIIILGILVQSGVATVSPTVFAWIVTLILPINSSVNPFLYTMSTAITSMLRKKNLKEDTHPEMQPMNQSRAAFDMSTVLTRTRANTIEKENST